MNKYSQESQEFRLNESHNMTDDSNSKQSRKKIHKD